MKPDPRTTARGSDDHDLPEDKLVAAGIPLDPDSESEPLETIASETDNDSVVDDIDPTEPEPAYFAPTDPVVGYNAKGDLEVLGGFEPTAMEDIDVASSSDHTYGDDALGEAIASELRADAATTDLHITVHVEEGVAYLHGTVPGLEDAQNAEDVASRIPGIREVVEELDIADL